MMSFKDIPILIMKLVRFSTKTMCKCLHMYPLLVGTLLVFFLMHLFFPFAFVSLLFSVPLFLAAFIVYTRFRFQKLPDGHRDLTPVKCEAKSTPRLKKPYISPQMSRRRNFRAKIEDPIPNEHRPMIDVSSPMKHFLSPDESVDQDDPNLIWRNEKIIEQSLSEFKNKETETNSSKNNKEETNSQIDHMLNDNDDDGHNDENEEVKVQGTSGIRIVGWNEDDQKNLMDLGLSETERNQRLENLIARRRARKFLMAIRGQASLLYENELETVQKMAPVKTDNIPASDDPVPGSAPSVLLPARNPFDIPYDPTEEKPNLTVDGFQQEFLGPHQISRHESFTLGPSFEVDEDQDSVRPGHQVYMDRIVKRESRFARLRRQPVQGDHDTLIEKLQNQQQDDPDDDESCSSPNKEEQEAAELSVQQKNTENTSDTEELQHARSQEASSSSDAVQNQRQQHLKQEQEQEINSSLDPALSTTKNNNEGCTNSSNTMYGSRDSYIDYLNNKVTYNLTHSIASDMLVEVSEPGSPSRNVITPMDFQSSDGEQEIEKASINFESQEEPPPPLNNTMQQVEEQEDNVMKQQEQDVIEIGASSSALGGEDKSSISVGNIEEGDEEESSGSVLALQSQSHSNEECNNNKDVGRERRQRSCESLDQVVEIPGVDEEEESIFFVDNSYSMPPLSPEQAAGDSRPTMQGNPEEIENQQPPVEDETDSRNIQDDEFRNQTGQDIISDTRKYDDVEYINPFANSVEEVIETNNIIGSTTSSHANGESVEEDIKEESQPSPIEQLISEPIDQAGVSHDPTDEQVDTKPVEGSRGEESQAPLEDEEAKPELVEESQGELQAAKSGLV